MVDGGGDGQLEWLCLEDTTTGERTRRNAEGLFLLLGAEPRCDWLPPSWPATSAASCSPAATSHVTDGSTGCRPANLATTVPGIFAAGDVRSGSMKRVAAASGEGASVVPLVHAYLEPAAQ